MRRVGWLGAPQATGRDRCVWRAMPGAPVPAGALVAVCESLPRAKSSGGRNRGFGGCAVGHQLLYRRPAGPVSRRPPSNDMGVEEARAVPGADGAAPRAVRCLPRGHSRSAGTTGHRRRASMMSFGMMVTRLAWMAHSCASSNSSTWRARGKWRGWPTWRARCCAASANRQARCAKPTCPLPLPPAPATPAAPGSPLPPPAAPPSPTACSGSPCPRRCPAAA